MAKVTIKEHLFQPLLIVTLALYALLITVNALSVFLNDWARRGDVERIGLLQTINLNGDTIPVGTRSCDANVDCLSLKSRLQAVAVLMLMAFVMSIAGFIMSMPLLLGRWIAWFGTSIAMASSLCYFLSMCIFLSISRNYFEMENSANFYQLSSGFGLCVVSWLLAIVVAVTAFLSWWWQATKWHKGRYCKFVC